jgi:hypothetical protein
VCFPSGEEIWEQYKANRVDQLCQARPQV